MKKLITLLLVLTGCIGTVSATSDYSIQFNESGNWYKLCDLTDEDGDGVYSAIVNFETANKLGWETFEIQLCTGESLETDWPNALWANFESNTSILSADAFTLSTTYSKGGKLTIPIKDATPDTYAIKFEFDSSTKSISATRLIEFASSNDDWHDSNPVYMEETAHNSKIFRSTMTLPNGTKFEFITNNNGASTKYSNKGDGYIDVEQTVIEIPADGVYTITANFDTYAYVAPALVKETVSVGTYGMATLCSKYALDFTGITNVKAYIITEHTKATGGLTKSQVTGKVKAETGLYLEVDANESADVPTTIYTTSAGTNMLVGVTASTDVSQVDGDNTNYILTRNTATGNVDTPKFCKVNAAGNTVPAGKAYLQIPTANAAPEFFWFNENMPTDISATLNNNEKIKNNKVFNLAGQRVMNPTKGLYIVKGKKAVIK